MPKPDRFIYRFEAKGIQRYVLASDRLKEIKGASILIEHLSELLKRAVALLKSSHQQAGGSDVEVAILYGAAGGATVSFSERVMADDLYSYWPLIVEQHAPGLKVVQAIVDREDATTDESDNLIEAMSLALQQDRARGQVYLPEAGPMVHRAPRSGIPALAPTDEIMKLADGGESLFDRAAAARIRAGSKEGARDALADRVFQGWPDAKLEPKFATDTDQLNARYVAVVHADGNDLGKLLREIVKCNNEPIEALSSFSQRLSQATLGAVQLALRDAYIEALHRSDISAFPGRPIIVGGDDMTFLMRSDLALSFTRKYLGHFEEQTKGIVHNMGAARPNLTACAGIAYVHQNYPFHLALDLAESLCRFTKRSLRGRAQGLTPSGLHFHRVTTAFAQSYDALLEGPLSPTQDHHMTMGPYALNSGLNGVPTIEQLESLMQTITGAPDAHDVKGTRRVKGVPRTALTEVVHLMERGDIARAGERLKRVEEVMTNAVVDREASAERWELFRRALKAMGVDTCSGWTNPPARTPLNDALNLIPVAKRSAKR